MKKFLPVLLLALILIVSGCVGQSSEPNVNPVQKISTLSKPGVVLIATVASGDVEIPEARIDFEGNLVPTDTTYVRKESITATGSGFIVSSEGYVVTNAHVVTFEEPLLEKHLIESAISKEFEEFVDAVGRQPTKQEADIIANYLFDHSKVKNTKTEVTVLLGSPQSTGKTVVEVPADIKKIGEPAPGKDVAIIKVDGKNYPTVKLGDSDKANIGDKVYPMGYPGVATFHPYLSKESITEPTLTAGIISAEKQLTKGFTALQTDAAITHGNSGGPVFNEQGEVIGISTFGSIDYSSGQEIAGFNFIVPINIAREFMREINVQNERGPVDENYELAMNAYWSDNYPKALESYDVVRNLYPNHPYVNKYIQDSQEKLVAVRVK